VGSATSQDLHLIKRDYYCAGSDDDGTRLRLRLLFLGRHTISSNLKVLLEI